MDYKIKRHDGSLIVTVSKYAGIEELIQLRSDMEHHFDAMVWLTISHMDPELKMRGASGEKLGKTETPEWLRIWLSGYFAGKKEL